MFKKNLLKRNKLLLLFMFLLIFMLLQIGGLSIVSQRQKFDTYANEANLELNRTVSALNNIFENIKQCAILLSLEKEIIAAFSKPLLTPVEQQALVNKLNDYKKIDSNIRDIYICNLEQAVIYSSVNHFKRLEEFPFPNTKQHIVNNTFQKDKFSVFWDKATTNKYGGGQVVRNRWSFNNQSDYLIFIDLDYDIIANIIKNCEENIGGNIYIKTGDGEFLYGGNSDEETARLLGVPSIKYQAIQKIDDNLVLHNSITQIKADIYSISRSDNIEGQNNQTLVFVIINIAIISAMFLVALIIYLFRNVYVIIKENEVLNESRSMRERFLESSAVIINCLTDGDNCDLNEMRQFFSPFAEKSDLNDVVLLRFDLHDCNCNDIKGKYELINRFEKILNRLVSAKVIYEQDEFMIFLLVDGGINYIDKCSVLYKECMAEALELMGVDISCFVSNSASILRLHELYSETTNLAEYKFIYNRPIFLDHTMLWKRKDERLQWSEFKIEAICDNVLSPKQNESILLDSFMSEIRNLSMESVRNMLYSLFLKLSQSIDKIKEEEPELVNFDMTCYLPKLSALKSLDEALLLFEKIVNDLKEKRLSSGGSEHTLITKRAIDIINEKVRDPSLCRNMVADEMRISPSYLSRIFKDQIGISLSDMINNAKLKLVEEQLKSTNKSIKEILDEIGFINQSYFTVMFKKKHKITPTEYRNT